MAHINNNIISGNVISRIGFGLATYGPFFVYVLFAFNVDISIFDYFSSFFAFLEFLSFFATFMSFFGWLFIIPALIISITGLIKKNNTTLNFVTLICSVGWFIIGFLVIVNFA